MLLNLLAHLMPVVSGRGTVYLVLARWGLVGGGVATEGLSWTLAVIGGGRGAQIGGMVGEFWALFGALVGEVAGGCIGWWGLLKICSYRLPVTCL